MQGQIFRKRLIRFMVALGVILTVGSLSLPVQAGVKVNPARIIFNLQPGERDTGVITVTNETDQTVDLLAVYYDWNLDQQNKLTTYKSGTLKETLDGLIKFNPRKFSLKPGESQLVRFTVTFPEGGEDVKPFERRGIIFFEHEDSFVEEGMGASVKTMIGSIVYLMPEVYELAFKLKGAKVGIGKDGKYWSGLLVQNDCLVHTRFTIDYKVIDADHKVIDEGEVDETVLLPGMSRVIFFPLQESYTSGSYNLMVNFNFEGTDEDMVQAIPFEVKE